MVKTREKAVVKIGKIVKNIFKSFKIRQNLSKPFEISPNCSKSVKIGQSQSKSVKVDTFFRFLHSHISDAIYQFVPKLRSLVVHMCTT